MADKEKKEEKQMKDNTNFTRIVLLIFCAFLVSLCLGKAFTNTPMKQTYKYTVQDGDGWFAIATKTACSWNDLTSINHSSSSTPIYAGTVLTLPNNSQWYELNLPEDIDPHGFILANSSCTAWTNEGLAFVNGLTLATGESIDVSQLDSGTLKGFKDCIRHTGMRLDKTFFTNRSNHTLEFSVHKIENFDEFEMVVTVLN